MLVGPARTPATALVQPAGAQVVLDNPKPSDGVMALQLPLRCFKKSRADSCAPEIPLDEESKDPAVSLTIGVRPDTREPRDMAIVEDESALTDRRLSQ